MATLKINQINAVNGLAIRNSKGTLTPPGSTNSVWLSNPGAGITTYNEGTDGSIAPVIFVTAAAAYTPAFTLFTDCEFATAQSAAAYDIVATLPIGTNNTDVPILRCTGNKAPTVTSGTSSKSILFKNFQLDSGLKIPQNCPVPFRLAGDFTWKLFFKTIPAASK